MGSETPEADIEDIKLLEEAKTRHLPLLVQRSSSSRPSLESYNKNKEGNIPHHDPIPKSKSDGDLSRKQGAISPPSSPSHTPQWSMVSASPTIGIYSPLTTSPPIQKMGTPSSFDPDRIPASVFSKPANTSEWSVASNDSLFSIHNSFNKDQIEPDESNTSRSLYVTEAKSSELCTLPPLMEVPPNEEGSAKSSSASIVEKEDSPKVASASPHLSNESGRSQTSFAFPVLESDGGKVSSSEGAVEEKPEVQPQELNAAQDSTMKGWLSCFPCCRCC